MNSTKKETLAAIIFLATNIVIVALCFLANFLLNNLAKVDYLFLKIILYIALCILTFQFNKRFPYKVFNIISFVIYLPITFLALFVALAIPVLSIQISLFLYLIFSFLIPIVIFRIDEYYHFTTLRFETWVYIITTSGVIFAFIFHKQIRFLANKTLPFNVSDSEKMKKFNLAELNNYVLSENNIRTVIFSLYLIYLIAINFWGLEGYSFYENPNIDKAVLQSFVTFVAFDRVLSALRVNEFRFSGLWDNFRKSVSHVFD